MRRVEATRFGLFVLTTLVLRSEKYLIISGQNDATSKVPNQPQHSPVLVPEDARRGCSRDTADNTCEVGKTSTGHLKIRRTRIG